MTRRRWVGTALVVIAICGAILLLAFRRDIAIAYHRHAMGRARAKIYEVGPSGDQMPWIESYERHRDRLVRLGYLARKEFPLSVRPPETNRLWRQLSAEFPDNSHAVMKTTEWGGTENTIIVWDRPHRMAEWDAAIRRLDVPEKTTSATAGVP